MLASPPVEERFKVALTDAETAWSDADVGESAVPAPFPDCAFCYTDKFGGVFWLEKPVVVEFFSLELIFHLPCSKCQKL
jgi:hypothetical protein